jgi:hypothetical protein
MGLALPRAAPFDRAGSPRWAGRAGHEDDHAEAAALSSNPSADFTIPTKPEIQKWATQTGAQKASNATLCCCFPPPTDGGRGANLRYGPTILGAMRHSPERTIWLADDAVPYEPVWGESPC